MIAGLRLAASLLTVLPVRHPPLDRRTSAVAMSLAPLIGAGVGAVIAGLVILFSLAGGFPLLAAVLGLAAGVLLTRGMHLDGLADMLDGLGAYGDRQRALAVMRQPDIGAFGVIGIVLVLLIQVAAVTALTSRGAMPLLYALVAVAAAGRLAVVLGCRRGVPAARRDGLGAMVAGTVPRVVPLLWLPVISGLAALAIPYRPWQGPVAVLLGLAAALLLLRHATRRFGGITGDVLGASVELTTTVTVVALALGA